MLRKLEDLWNDALSRASMRFSNPGMIQNWLKDTKPLSLEDDVLTIAVVSEFAKTWIETRYKEELAEAWKEAYGDRCELVFSVSRPEKPVPEAPALFPRTRAWLPGESASPTTDTSR